VYRTALSKQSTTSNNTYIERIDWSLPCFAEAIQKVNRYPTYRLHGIALFVANLGITQAIKNEKILIGAMGDHRIERFVKSISGFIFNLKHVQGFDTVMKALNTVVKKIPKSHWKRVAKISMSHADGGQIEYTTSSVNSLSGWYSIHSRHGNLSQNNPNHFINMCPMLQIFDTHITSSISEFVFQSKQHIVSLQPGILRTPPGTVPQCAHRDFHREIYLHQFPGQVYIGFMPISIDGSFLQVWNSPGLAKLVFIPYGSFLLLPGNTIHAGWMCTSLSEFNLRFHFYILVSKDPDTCSRNETYFFENMNSYIDEESQRQEPLYTTHHTALSECPNFIGL
jgi:hypothetical protein